MNANLDLAFDFLQPIKVKALKMLSAEENTEQGQKKKELEFHIFSGGIRRRSQLG